MVVGGGGEVAIHALFCNQVEQGESTCSTNFKKCSLCACKCNPNLGECHLLT